MPFYGKSVLDRNVPAALELQMFRVHSGSSLYFTRCIESNDGLNRHGEPGNPEHHC